MMKNKETADNDKEIHISAEIFIVINKIKLLNMLMKGAHTSTKRVELKRRLIYLEETHWEEIADYYLLGG